MALITLFTESTKSSVTNGVIAQPIGTIHLNDAIPAVTSYGVFIYNFTDASISVTPQIAPVNVKINGGSTSPYINLTAVTIDAGAGQYISYEFNQNPAPYFQVSISATGSGIIEGFYFVNYLYTTH